MWSIQFNFIFFFFIQFQIENQDDGIRILHILGIEHRHSGEIQCLAYNSLNPSATQRVSYTELAVLPRPIQLNNLNANDNTIPYEAKVISNNGNGNGVAGAVVNEAITNATTAAVAQQTFKQIADVPAYLIRGPDDCIALVGGNICLTVTYGGYPKPTIKWLRAVSTSSFIYLLFYCYCSARKRSLHFLQNRCIGEAHTVVSGFSFLLCDKLQDDGVCSIESLISLKYFWS